ncbi:MAG TPA: acyl-CoA dehydrogenase family protein [Pseudolabrys sp.]
MTDIGSASAGALDNQPPPYGDVDLFGSDPALMAAVRTFGAAEAVHDLAAFGRRWGRADLFAAAETANERIPQLITGADGRRDVVAFDESYHRFMRESIADGLQASTWSAAGARAPAPAEMARAARFYMVAQVENGHMCPITMTRAAVAALQAQPDLLTQLMPQIASRHYDPRFLPWGEKHGMTLGMGMTERQGGTDVRSNTSRALSDGDHYRITGHKWFMSAPMCDAFLVLAQADGGLTCFFMPRFRPDGTVNRLMFRKLKDKLGNRSNASSEVDFEDAYALRVGDEGRGIRTILSMVQLTRLDCAISSAGLMRAALARALHHTRHRIVFQKHLADQPMMTTVLADLALTSEAAMALALRLARAFDHAATDEGEAAYARLMTPAVKYWICKTAPGFVYEAMECLGGNGYVADSAMPRLYREAPVNAIWEGSGNVMALDVLRVLRDGAQARAVLDALRRVTTGLPGADAACDDLLSAAQDPALERHARDLVERLAVLAAAAALAEMGSPAAVSFAESRLARSRGSLFGAMTLSEGSARDVLARAVSER